MRALLQRLTGKPALDPAPPPVSRHDYVPFDGWENGRISIPLVETLTDEQLLELNAILEWNCFVVDSKGRRFGTPSSPRKRVRPQSWPDQRVVELHERFDLSDKTVLEIGCFEGIHTSAMCRWAREVKACDARIGNVVKTVVRCAMFETIPRVFVWDVEKAPPDGVDIGCDVLHHQGVLYHLVDPVGHLERLLPHVRYGLLLDTHFAEPEELDSEYEGGGRTWRCRYFPEGPADNPFAGMSSMARWLLLDDLLGILKEQGFGDVHISEKRSERNGSRVLLYARR